MSLGDSIGSLFVKIGVDLSELQSGLDEASAAVAEKSSSMMSGVSAAAERLAPAGKGLVAVGGAITGVMALSVAGALEEEQATARLKVALENTGTAYASVEEAINSQMGAATKSTNFSDTEQMAALTSLVQITGSYEQAIGLLPTALDLAAAKQMSAEAAAQLLGKVAEGNTGVLKRYGISLGEDATAAEALDAVHKQVTGSAEAMANPLVILKNGFGDICDQVGAVLVPILKTLVDAIMPAVKWVQDFATEHPLLTKVLVIVAAAIGAVALVLGGLILLLPTIIGGVTALTAILPLLGGAFTVALGPIGLIILAIAALIAIVLLVWKYHEQIADFFVAVWKRIKDVFWMVVDWIKEWGLYFLGPIGMIIENWGRIKDFFSGLWDGIKDIFYKGVNAVIDVINIFIRAYNSIPILGDIGEIGHLGEGGGGATGEMDAALEEGRRQQAAADAAVAAQNAAMAAAQDAAAAQYMADQASATAQGYEMIQGMSFSGYQHGGIAVHPQVATLAEHEPELITPVSMLADLFSGGRRGGDTVNVYVGGNIMAEADLADTIRNELFKVRNRNVAVGLT